MKLEDEFLEKVVGGGNITELIPSEVNRLNEILGNDGVVVCYASDETNGGEIDSTCIIISRYTQESLVRLRENGNISLLNGIRCVHLSPRTVWNADMVRTSDNVGNRIVFEM